ncbi:MAG: hypothetical protein ACXV8Q_00380 [Methylobacter sp.]
MPLVLRNIKDLPPKILAVIEQEGQTLDFQCAIKTNFKPNATIPILWIVLTNIGFLLCNTHRTRGLSGRYDWQEINEVRKKQGTGKVEILEIIFNHLSKDDIVLPMPAEVTSADMMALIELSAALKSKAA